MRSDDFEPRGRNIKVNEAKPRESKFGGNRDRSGGGRGRNC